jgi:two-component system NtrC family response regulator
MPTALIVEDQPDIARLCERLLARRGMSVRTAANCKEAMAILDAEGGSFCVAYVDIGLPDGSGLDIAAHAGKAWPALPIVLATGALQEVAAGGCVVLRKPFTLTQFDDAIANALRRAPPPGGGAAPSHGTVAAG